MIGPLAKDASEQGGATRSFVLLATYFQKKDPSVAVFNSQLFRYKRSFLTVLSTLVQSVRKADIVFLNVSQNGIRFLGPLVWFITKTRGKKLVVRPFGGWLDTVYDKGNPLLRFIFKKTIFKADIFYLQTKLLLQYFQPLIANL